MTQLLLLCVSCNLSSLCVGENEQKIQIEIFSIYVQTDVGTMKNKFSAFSPPLV